MQFLALISIASQFFFGSCATTPSDAEYFSGVYNPSIQHNLEMYAGAYLIPKKSYMDKKHMMDGIYALEQTTTSIIQEAPHYGQSSVSHIMMTRDYLDFFVEHLSAYTNTLKEEAYHDILYNATHKARLLRSRALGLGRHAGRHPKRDDVVVIIPFATTSARSGSSDITSKLRLAFFEQTFWSISRYFPKITVSVSKAYDLKVLLSLGLPIDQIFSSTTNDDPKANYAANVKQAVIQVYEQLKSNSTWSNIKYIYFSEGDLVLHARHLNSLMDIMTSSPPNEHEFALSPHRMQVC
jgi:hypothetical protein